MDPEGVEGWEKQTWERSEPRIFAPVYPWLNMCSELLQEKRMHQNLKWRYSWETKKGKRTAKKTITEKAELFPTPFLSLIDVFCVKSWTNFFLVA